LADANSPADGPDEPTEAADEPERVRSSPPQEPHEPPEPPPAIAAILPFLRRSWPYVPVIVATLVLAKITLGAVLAKAGEPAVPLDDAYIHFQYARSLAEGRFFAFVPGEGYTSGATSLLWPLALAPFYALGFRDVSIIWIAWFYGFLFLGLLAVETRRLARHLVGEHAAIGAGAMVLAFGGYTWFAASGMEVSPLGYCLALVARLAAEWQEDVAKRSKRNLKKLLLLSLLGPLVRPEGILVSGIVLLTLALFPSDGASSWSRASFSPRTLRLRAWALGALVGPLVPSLINRALTGHFATSTTLVKWLPPNPYYGGKNLSGLLATNFDTFHRTLLDGREWSALFLPTGARPVMIAAFFAIFVAGHRSGRVYRAALVILLAAAMALPTTYLSFLWNRLRYLWPFAFAWCIGFACLATAIADLASYFRPRFVSLAGVLTGIGAGLVGHHLSWCIDDVAGAASAIHRQQVALGRWAKNALPDGASIGVSDTGAIAYFGEHRTFDVVGLTTPAEAKYWVAGAGARYEHYEHLHREKPGTLPTHFIVYQHWMACDAVLGRELHHATVTDSTILGGQTMTAYEADYTRLGRGDRPLKPPPGRLVDELDVADLESEEAHRYDVLASLASDADVVVFETRRASDQADPNAGEGKLPEPRRPAGLTEDDDDDFPPPPSSARSKALGEQVFDGGRNRRTLDRFALTVPKSGARLVVRLASPLGASVTVKINGRLAGRHDVTATTWTEETFDLPPGDPALADVRAGDAPADVTVEASDGRVFGSLHYWVYAW
jgi:hypothetical protein